MGLQLEGCVCEKAGLWTGLKGPEAAGRETVSWMDA